MSRNCTDLNEVSNLSTGCDHNFALRVAKSSKVLVEGIEQTDASHAIGIEFDGRAVDVSALWIGIVLWAGYFDEDGTRLGNNQVVDEDIVVVLQWAQNI